MAIGVAALPAVAGFKGWSWVHGPGTAGCVTLTVMAAFYAYTTRQGEVATALQISADGYESARHDEADARQDGGAARAEAAAIAELASVAGRLPFRVPSLGSRSCRGPIVVPGGTQSQALGPLYSKIRD